MKEELTEDDLRERHRRGFSLNEIVDLVAAAEEQVPGVSAAVEEALRAKARGGVRVPGTQGIQYRAYCTYCDNPGHTLGTCLARAEDLREEAAREEAETRKKNEVRKKYLRRRGFNKTKNEKR